MAGKESLPCASQTSLWRWWLYLSLQRALHEWALWLKDISDFKGKYMGQSDKEHGQPHEAPLPPRGENKPDMPPLLVALILKAGEEGHAMQHLAQSLGGSYARLNQRRRGESHIGQAQRSVRERGAKYLGMPGVVVQALAQNITLADFFWPEEGDLERRIGNGVEELFADKFLGGFVPPGLRDAEPS